MTRRNFFKALAGVGAVFLGSAAVGMTSPAGQKVPKQIIHIRGESQPLGYPLSHKLALAEKLAEDSHFDTSAVAEKIALTLGLY